MHLNSETRLTIFPGRSLEAVAMKWLKTTQWDTTTRTAHTSNILTSYFGFADSTLGFAYCNTSWNMNIALAHILKVSTFFEPHSKDQVKIGQSD